LKDLGNSSQNRGEEVSTDEGKAIRKFELPVFEKRTGIAIISRTLMPRWGGSVSETRSQRLLSGKVTCSRREEGERGSTGKKIANTQGRGRKKILDFGIYEQSSVVSEKAPTPSAAKKEKAPR